MASYFSQKVLQIPRVSNIDSETFRKYYRNKQPVILPDIVSNWVPMDRWTPSYLTETLKQTYNDKLQVFVSKDNTQFINHPDVTELVTMSAEEFASNVFQNHHSSDEEAETADNHQSIDKGTQNTDAKTRYYLRTFSMPEVLFHDVVNSQVDSLLNVLVNKDENLSSLSSENGLRCHKDKPQDGEQFKGDDVSLKDLNANKDTSSNKDEPISAWEDFLSPGSISDEEEDAADLSEGASHAEKYETKYRATHSRIFNPETMQLWIGTRGNVTPLHYDRNHGLLTQISGRKELVVFSHEDTEFLYPHSSYSDRAHTSRINLRRLGDSNYAELFSKVEKAQAYTCILEPGELLYTPPFWWHDVTSLDNCVSVTLPWDIEGYEEVPPCMLR